jgi:opacity protein-like surface antigen
MKRFFAALLVASLAFSACLAAAPNPVGTWKGKFYRDSAKAPVGKTPQEKAVIAVYEEMVTSMRATFKVKADHTFSMDLRGTAQGKPQGSVTEGTWKLEGSTVVTKSLKRDGKAIPKEAQTTNKLVLDKEGKTLTNTMKNGPITGKVVLKRV